MKKIVVKARDFVTAGRSVGEETRDDIVAVCESITPHLLASGFSSQAALTAATDEFTRLTNEGYPYLISWLRGVSQGSGVSEHAIHRVAFSEELMALAGAPPEKCSTLAMETDDGWIVAHNEDYLRDYLGRMYVLVLSIEGWPTTVSLNYPAQLPNLAGTLNERGFCISHNSLPMPGRYGESLQARHTLATLAQTFAFAHKFLSSYGPSPLGAHFTLLGSAGYEALSIEMGNASVTDPGPCWDWLVHHFAHANHPLLLAINEQVPAGQDSPMRQCELEQALADMWGFFPGPDGLIRVMSQEVGRLNRQPHSEEPDASVTLATVVMRPRTREFWAYGRGPGDTAIHVTL